MRPEVGAVTERLTIEGFSPSSRFAFALLVVGRHEQPHAR